jgi:hypothetical protein
VRDRLLEDARPERGHAGRRGRLAIPGADEDAERARNDRAAASSSRLRRPGVLDNEWTIGAENAHVGRLKSWKRGKLESSANPGGSAKRLKGFEPSTFCMASRRSSQLSYSRARASV